MSRPPGSLTIYVAFDPRRPAEVRLLVARSFAQADSMIPPGWLTKVVTRFEAYRYGRAGIELEYYFPKSARADITDYHRGYNP